MTAATPEDFTELKNLVRIHLKQILKIDKITIKVPTNTVALLILVAYEALSKLRHPRKGPEFLFAFEYQRRHHVPIPIGGAIFNALRNGLAHRYDPYPIVVDALGEVRLELAWKDCAAYHLRGVGIDKIAGHQKVRRYPQGSTVVPRVLCLNVESMWHDLDDLFAQYEKSLQKDVSVAARLKVNAQTNLQEFTRKVLGSSACQWRDFLSAQRAEEK